MIKHSVRLSDTLSRSLKQHCLDAGISVQDLLSALVEKHISEIATGRKCANAQMRNVANAQMRQPQVPEIIEPVVIAASVVPVSTSSTNSSVLNTLNNSTWEIEGVQGGKEPVGVATSPKRARSADKVYVNDASSIPLPEQFETPECRAAVREWLAYKSHKKQVYTRSGFDSMMKRLARSMNAAEFCDAVSYSIEAPYTGIYPRPKQRGASPSLPARETNFERNMRVLYGDSWRDHTLAARDSRGFSGDTNLSGNSGALAGAVIEVHRGAAKGGVPALPTRVEKRVRSGAPSNGHSSSPSHVSAALTSLFGTPGTENFRGGVSAATGGGTPEIPAPVRLGLTAEEDV